MPTNTSYFLLLVCLLLPLVVVALDDLPALRLIVLLPRILVGVEGSGVASDRLMPLEVLLDVFPSSGSGVEVMESATEVAGEESLLLVRVRLAGGNTGEVSDSSSRIEDID